MNKHFLPYIVACAVILGCVLLYNSQDKVNTILKRNYKELLSENAKLKAFEQQAIDSANYYNSASALNQQKVDSLTGELSKVNKKLNHIPVIIADMSADEAYDSLQSILSPPIDSLNYCFDGNQTKELYEDELELMVMKEAFVICENTVDAQNDALGLKGMENYHLGVALDSCQKRAENSETIANSAVNDAEETKQRLRTWKIGTIGGGSALLLLLLLL